MTFLTESSAPVLEIGKLFLFPFFQMLCFLVLQIFWGPFFFDRIFNAIGIFRSPSVMFFVGNFVTKQDHFSIVFQVYFSISFYSYWVSTSIRLSFHWLQARNERTLCIIGLLSQNLDTSPEARTVWSKLSILFEVFWL